MDMQGALRARLLATPQVTALVAQRVDWVIRPQTAALPAVTLQTISGDRPQTHAGFEEMRTARVQCDVWATTYASARAITEAIVRALAPKAESNGVRFGRMFFEGDRDLLDTTATTPIHRTSLDLIVWHAQA